MKLRRSHQRHWHVLVREDPATYPGWLEYKYLCGAKGRGTVAEDVIKEFSSEEEFLANVSPALRMCIHCWEKFDKERRQ